MIRLIATDIDGTLLPMGCLNPDAVLTSCLRRLIDRGVAIALTSGRPLSAMDGLFPEIQDRLIYICSNGARIVQNGKTIFLSPLAEGSDLAKLMAMVRSLGCDYLVDSETAILAEPGVSAELIRTYTEAGLNLLQIPDVTACNEPILKLSIAQSENSAVLAERLLALQDQYTIAPPTFGRFFDVTSKDTDKGVAVRFLQTQLGIAPEETAVFGDGINDIPLFSVTENSYAVETAPVQVRQEAKYTVAPPEQGGVLEILQTIITNYDKENGT